MATGGKMTFEEFIDSLPDQFEAVPQHFGDYWTFFAKDVDYYAEQIDERRVVYRSMETDEVIGCKVWA